MEALLKSKEEHIQQLNERLEEKDELIRELRSKLDKFQSVLSRTQNSIRCHGPRKVRAQGISAEPQVLSVLQDDERPEFHRRSKPDRFVS